MTANTTTTTAPRYTADPNAAAKAWIGSTITGNGWIIHFDAEADRTRVYIDGDPTPAQLAALEEAHFFRSPVSGTWNKKLTCKAYRAAVDLANALDALRPLEEIAAPIREVEPETIYAGWTGEKARTWNTDADLKAALLADFKAAGIKASIRFHRGGYTTALTVTVTLPADAVRPFEAYAWEPFRGCDSWGNYTDAAGVRREIHQNEFYTLPAADQDAIRAAIIRDQYAVDVKSLAEGTYRADALTDAANAVMAAARRIVDGYNHDQSNGQVDYFDRDIYDHYAVRIPGLKAAGPVQMALTDIA